MSTSVKTQKNMYLQIMSELLPKVGVAKIEEASAEAMRIVKIVGRSLRRIERRASLSPAGAGASTGEPKEVCEDKGGERAIEKDSRPVRSHWVGMPDPLVSVAGIEQRDNDPDFGTYEIYYNVSANDDEPEPDECRPTLLEAICYARAHVEGQDHLGFTIRVNDVSIVTVHPGRFTWQIPEKAAIDILVYEEMCNPIDWRA